MWETVEEKGYDSTDRMKVPGGWLVRCTYRGYHGGGVHVIFLDDPAHEWTLEK